MTFKGMLLQRLRELGIRQPDLISNINDEDKDKNRLTWQLQDGYFIFDVLDISINYLYNVEGYPMQIHTLYDIDEAVVVALKYLR